MDPLSKLLEDFKGLITSLQVQLADTQAALEAEKLISYNKGFADGVASVPVGDPSKKYSEEELVAKVAEAVAPLQTQIDSLKADVEAVKAESDAKAAQAVSDVKAVLLQSYKDLEVAVQTVETGFEDKLK